MGIGQQEIGKRGSLAHLARERYDKWDLLERLGHHVRVIAGHKGVAAGDDQHLGKIGELELLRMKKRLRKELRAVWGYRA